MVAFVAALPEWIMENIWKVCHSQCMNIDLISNMYSSVHPYECKEMMKYEKSERDVIFDDLDF